MGAGTGPLPLAGEGWVRGCALQAHAFGPRALTPTLSRKREREMQGASVYA